MPKITEQVPPAAVVTCAQAQALDQAEIAAGTTGAELMTHAGTAVANAAMRRAKDGRVVVVAGTGQNGGDGYVVGFTLHQRGVPVTVVIVGERAEVTGDARTMLDRLDEANSPTFDIHADTDLAALDVAFDGAAVIVDAMFGIGLSRPIDGFRAEVIAHMNASAAQRIAVDLPSGIHADTGEVLGAAVRAHLTIAMGGIKRGCLQGAGIDYTGELDLCDLWSVDGVSKADLHAFTPDDARLLVPRARASEHKGDRGHVVVVGGNPGMRGAGQLAGLAALRAGSGLVTWTARANSGGELPAAVVLMTHALAPGEVPQLDSDTVVVLGPGLGRTDDMRVLAKAVLASGARVLVDADALDMIDPLGSAAVITPHPGEAARMLGITVAEVEADRLGAARALATQTGAVTVLKGARTIVCDGDRATINLGGSSTLATGGSGDVLAGVIGALMAQGLAPGDAARLGVFVHARGGELLGQRFGARGAIASDIPEAVALALSELR